MTDYRTTKIVKKGKTLLLFTANLNSTEVPGYIPDTIGEAFEQFAEYMQEDSQVMYIRDIPELCINGTHPYSYSGPREAIIAINRWGLGLDMEQFTLVVYKELFNMARLQNAGSEGTFGDAVFSEGAGLYFGKLMTTFEPVCSKVNVTSRMRRAAMRRWEFRYFSYRRWFYKGRRGQWIAPAIGYELAESLYPLGRKSDLRAAIHAQPQRFADSLKELNREWLYSL